MRLRESTLLVEATLAALLTAGSAFVAVVAAGLLAAAVVVVSAAEATGSLTILGLSALATFVTVAAAALLATLVRTGILFLSEVVVALSVVSGIFRFHELLLGRDERPLLAAWLSVSNINSLDATGSKENCVKLAQVSESVHFLPIFTGSSEETVAVNDLSHDKVTA